jgi:hypothetical protein
MNIVCDSFYQCPECGSEWFTLYSKLPTPEALKVNSLKGIFLYAVNANTNKAEAMIVCSNGHRFKYNELENTYDIDT